MTWDRNKRENWNLKSRVLTARDKRWHYTPFKRTAWYRAVFPMR